MLLNGLVLMAHFSCSSRLLGLIVLGLLGPIFPSLYGELPGEFVGQRFIGRHDTDGVFRDGTSSVDGRGIALNKCTQSVHAPTGQYLIYILHGTDRRKP